MRVWDARYANCLDVVLDHGADVYGKGFDGHAVIDLRNNKRKRKYYIQILCNRY